MKHSPRELYYYLLHMPNYSKLTSFRTKYIMPLFRYASSEFVGKYLYFFIFRVFLLVISLLTRRLITTKNTLKIKQIQKFTNKLVE